MTTQQKSVIGIGIIAAFIFLQGKPRQELTASDIEPIIIKTESAFSQAESKILKVVPDDDIEPLGPDPDVDKCICKGTGQYERPDLPGSGKMVDCPYHSVSNSSPVVKEVEVLETQACTPAETIQIQKKNYRRPLLWFLRKR